MRNRGNSRCLLVASFIASLVLTGCGQQESSVADQDLDKGGEQASQSDDNLPSEEKDAAAEAGTPSGADSSTEKSSTSESDQHDTVRQWLTQLVGEEASAREAARAELNNAAVERILEKEKELGSHIKFDDIVKEVAGVYPSVMLEGESSFIYKR